MSVILIPFFANDPHVCMEMYAPDGMYISSILKDSAVVKAGFEIEREAFNP